MIIRLFAILFFFVSWQAFCSNPSGEYSIFLEKAKEELLSSVNQKNSTESVANTMDKYVNLKYAVKFVLGSNWRDLSESERIEAFKVYRLFISKKEAILLKSSKTTLEIIGQEDGSSDDEKFVVVNARFLDKEGKMTNSNFKFRIKKYEDGSYKILDIMIEDLSFLQLQRNEFNSTISSKGIKYLISFMNDFISGKSTDSSSNKNKSKHA